MTAELQIVDKSENKVRGILKTSPGEEAADALGKIKDPRTVDALIPLLKNKNYLVRSWSAHALREIKDPRALDALMASLKDEYSLVRWKSAAALGEIKDYRAVDALITSLKDNDSTVRNNSAWALEKITGLNFGTNVVVWEEWWKSKRNRDKKKSAPTGR